MTYRDQLLALADQSERRAVNAYSMFQRGWLSRGEIIAILAAIVATAKGQAASLAAMGLAAELMSRLQRPMPVTLLPVVDDLGRLRKAAATVLEVADQSDVPDAIVGRLAHSEPLETAANSYSEAMNRSPLVKGWVRQLSPNACELCRWWWREGRIWPAEHPMPTHKGCTCTPKPVLAERIESTMSTRRYRNAG